MEEILLGYYIFTVGLLLLAWYAYLVNMERKKKRLEIACKLLSSLRGKRRISENEYEDAHRRYAKILDVPGRISNREISFLHKVSDLIEKKK